MILELLKNICNSLSENKINYMISGSIAMNVYTIPRMTRDIDIVIELNEDLSDSFISLINDFYYDKDTIVDAIKRHGMFNVIDNNTGFKIDFIIRKNTEYYKLAFSRRKLIKEFDTQLWIISIEDLIIAKLIWIQQLKSEIQINDIQNLLLVTDKDMNYIKFWCNKLKLNSYNLIANE